MYWKYFKYIIRHKWFVFVECFKRGIIWQGIMHDLSKFRPSEFIPYTKYFYGKKSNTIGVQIDFDKAWLLHIHRNPHHWQYWILQEDDGPLKMIPIPLKYLVEMGCDWLGAGRAITGKNNITEWYAKNCDKIKMSHVNREWLESFFNLKTIRIDYENY